MHRLSVALFLLTVSATAVSSQPIADLVKAVRLNSQAPDLDKKIKEVLGEKGGTAVWGQDFLFVTPSNSPASIAIDGQSPSPMAHVGSSPYWMRLEKMRTGTTHAYQFFADGKPLGNRSDVAGYNPDSYPHDGVPQGKLSEKHTLTSRIYTGMKADFWVYASPGVDPAVPAPLMVWQDGQGLVNVELSKLRLFTVTENLIAQKLIPPMVHVLIAPGFAPDGKPMRSVEYDTVSDRYNHFLLEEVLPEVEKVYKLRPDGYSRGIGGESSGGICSLNSAWFNPEKFARVHSAIGSYTSIQWHPEERLTRQPSDARSFTPTPAGPSRSALPGEVSESNEGGNLYPFMVRKLPKRNIRIWMSDGTDDLENTHGSWPLQNIQLANSLKMREYDFHFRFGLATHDGAQSAIDLPESLTWLWRGYDPSKTSDEFTIDPAEKDKPYYRVTVANRDAW